MKKHNINILEPKHISVTIQIEKCEGLIFNNKDTPSPYAIIEIYDCKYKTKEI